MRVALVLLGLCLACVAPVLATEVSATVLDPFYKFSIGYAPEAPRIDWVQRAILVTTQVQGEAIPTPVRSRLAARQLALDDARAQIGAALCQLRLTDYTTLPDAVETRLLDDDPIPQLLQGVKPVAETWDDTKKNLMLVSALPLVGIDRVSEVAARLLTVEQNQLAKGQTPRKHPTIRMIFNSQPAPKQLSAGPYSGVILDCRKLNYTPVLLPKLLNRDGTEIWGTVGVNTLLVSARNIAIYSRSLKEALASGRVGKKPLLIRPIGTAGVSQGDLVLRPEDVAVLLNEETNTHFLSTLSLAILLD